jgi:hypothetical protein
MSYVDREALFWILDRNLFSLLVTYEQLHDDNFALAGLIIALVASNSVGHATSECAWYFVA